MLSFWPKKSIFSCLGSSNFGAEIGGITGASVFYGIEIGLTSVTGLVAGADLSSRSFSPQSAE